MFGTGLDIRENVDIKPHTTFGVGGSVRYFVEVDKAIDAIDAIKYAESIKTPYVIMAGGSNLVFNDGLLELFVVKIKDPILYLLNGEPVENISYYKKIEGMEIIFCALVKLMDLVTFSISHGLAGLESLSGIPGSVGGAIVGNAGAYGQTASGGIIEVEIFDGENIRKLTKQECQFTYRNSLIKNKPWLVLSVRYELSAGDKDELQKKSKEIIETRNKKYSPGIKCPGSFFKNILIDEVPAASHQFLPKDRDYYGKVPAWHFLDQIGAKGMVEGGIKIADFHGNLLINTGNATFEDVWTLAQRLKAGVKERFGIDLEEEVRYIGASKNGS